MENQWVGLWHPTNKGWMQDSTGHMIYYPASAVGVARGHLQSHGLSHLEVKLFGPNGEPLEIPNEP